MISRKQMTIRAFCQRNVTACSNLDCSEVHRDHQRCLGTIFLICIFFSARLKLMQCRPVESANAVAYQHAHKTSETKCTHTRANAAICELFECQIAIVCLSDGRVPRHSTKEMARVARCSNGLTVRTAKTVFISLVDWKVKLGTECQWSCQKNN